MVEEEEKKEVVENHCRQDMNIIELPPLKFEHRLQKNSDAEQK